jgi:RimJ/RimL family protein N-acetyltransferase
MTPTATLASRPELATQRLRLRRPADKDAANIINAVGDIDVARSLARIPVPYTAQDAAYFLSEIVPNEWVWAITLCDNDGLIGMVGLTPEEGAHTAELGYWLAKPYWARGIASEAARRVVEFGFDSLAMPYITADYFLSNPASGRVLRKLGFEETGETMRPCLALGENVRARQLRLLPHQLT